MHQFRFRLKFCVWLSSVEKSLHSSQQAQTYKNKQCTVNMMINMNAIDKLTDDFTKLLALMTVVGISLAFQIPIQHKRCVTALTSIF